MTTKNTQQTRPRGEAESPHTVTVKCHADGSWLSEFEENGRAVFRLTKAERMILKASDPRLEMFLGAPYEVIDCKPSATKDTSAHTPGPWRVYDDDASATITVKAPWSDNVKPGQFEGYGDYRGGTICTIEHQGDFAPVVTKRKALANARLIASAPQLLAERDELRKRNAELLAAASEAANWLSRSIRQDDLEMAEDLRAAIQKAERSA